MPELERVELDQLRLRRERAARVLQRSFEQMLGGREPRVFAVHRGGRDSGDAQRPGRTLRRPRQRMRLVRQMAALAGRLRGD